KVVGMQAFDVHDAVPAVAGAVDTRGVLDRVEGEPDTGVSRGVRAWLETEPVEFGDHVDELAAGVARPAPKAGAVRVVLQHQRRVWLALLIGLARGARTP